MPMFIKASNLRQLDVINVEEGSYLGNVCDVDLNPDNGRINFLVVDRPRFFFLWRSRRDDLEIPWQDIVLIGKDVVLVKNRAWHR